MTKLTKALVLHSGGIDSSVCLALARKPFDEVISISVNYGQRHAKEMAYAQMLSSHYAIEHREVEISTIPTTMLTDPSKQLPEVSYADLPSGISPTYVPFRNGLLLSTVASIAQAEEADAIYFGAHAEDAQNWAYPDCTPEFIGSMANAIFIGTYQKTRLLTPLMWMMKRDIIHLGMELNLPFELTWSCLAKGTKVRCLSGLHPIESLKVGQFVWGWEENELRWVPTRILNVFDQGVKEVFEVTLHDKAGNYKTFEATADHQIALRDGGYAMISDLSSGDRLQPSNPSLVRVGKNKIPYYMIKPHNLWDEKPVYMHRYVAEFFGTLGEVVHHKNTDSLNNDPDNLEGLRWGVHTRRHFDAERSNSPEANQGRSEKVAAHWWQMTKEARQARVEAIREGRRENHTVMKIQKSGEKPTWDIQTGTGNFGIGAGIFVHNCYKGGEYHCGTCPTCRSRHNAFMDADGADPTTYEEIPNG